MLNFTPVIVSDLDSNLRKPKEYLTYHYRTLHYAMPRPVRERNPGGADIWLQQNR